MPREKHKEKIKFLMLYEQLVTNEESLSQLLPAQLEQDGVVSCAHFLERGI